MNKKDIYFFIGGFLSFLIYGVLIFFLYSYIGSFEKISKRYTAKKNNFIEISISPIKKNKQRKKSIKKVSKPVKKRVKKDISKKKPIKKRKNRVKKSIKRDNDSKSLESLFKNINTKKYIKKIKDKNITKQANQNSRIPKKSLNGKKSSKVSAEKLVKSLTFESVESSVNKRSGEYNEYLGKISDMLDSKWQETASTIPGNSASVTVKIDKFGNFSYKIDTLSYNNEFNAKLENFLESLKDEKFPPYKNGDYVEIKVNFKDE